MSGYDGGSDLLQGVIDGGKGVVKIAVLEPERLKERVKAQLVEIIDPGSNGLFPVRTAQPLDVHWLNPWTLFHGIAQQRSARLSGVDQGGQLGLLGYLEAVELGLEKRQTLLVQLAEPLSE